MNILKNRLWFKYVFKVLIWHLFSRFLTTIYDAFICSVFLIDAVYPDSFYKQSTLTFIFREVALT